MPDDVSPDGMDLDTALEAWAGETRAALTELRAVQREVDRLRAVDAENQRLRAELRRAVALLPEDVRATFRRAPRTPS